MPTTYSSAAAGSAPVPRPPSQEQAAGQSHNESDGQPPGPHLRGAAAPVVARVQGKAAVPAPAQRQPAPTQPQQAPTQGQQAPAPTAWAPATRGVAAPASGAAEVPTAQAVAASTYSRTVPLAGSLTHTGTDRTTSPEASAEQRPTPANGDLAGGRPGRMARLRIGSHAISRPALAQLSASAPAAGLILGADQQRTPVSVRFFRPEATRVTLVGGTWAGQLIAFRAMALGARVVAVTVDPTAWQGFADRTKGFGHKMAVLTAEQKLAFVSNPYQPTLVIYDLGLVGASVPPPLGPWQTQLTILRRLDPSGIPALQGCQLSILQRLTAAETSVAESVLGLPRDNLRFLQVMADDMLAAVDGEADRYLWIAQTSVEQGFAGAPRR